MRLTNDLAEEDYCYLTTTGRKTGEPRTIEIWFAATGNRLYLLSGGQERSHWVKNLQKQPAVAVRIGESTFSGRARVIVGAIEVGTARDLVFDKYRTRDASDLTGWRDSALPVAIDLE